MIESHKRGVWIVQILSSEEEAPNPVRLALKRFIAILPVIARASKPN